MLKLVVVVLWLLIGESIGVAGFALYLHNYGAHLTFSWPITIRDLATYFALASGVLVLPVALAEAGSRMFDARFKH